jgi:hypothetical protein
LALLFTHCPGLAGCRLRKFQIKVTDPKAKARCEFGAERRRETSCR